MKVEQKDTHVVMTPETRKDVEYLRKKFPHLKNFRSVCVANPPAYPKVKP